MIPDLVSDNIDGFLFNNFSETLSYDPDVSSSELFASLSLRDADATLLNPQTRCKGFWNTGEISDATIDEVQPDFQEDSPASSVNILANVLKPELVNPAIISVPISEPLGWDSFGVNSGTAVKNTLFRTSSMTPHFTDRSYEFIEAVIATTYEKPIESELMLSSLFNLCIGRESRLFVLNTRGTTFKLAQLHTFVSKDSRGQSQGQGHYRDPYPLRVSGLSPESMTLIIQFCLVLGTRFARLKAIIERIDSEPNISSILVAFSQCIDNILTNIEIHVSKEIPCQVLDLFSLFQEPSDIIYLLTTILGCSDTSKDLRLKSLPSPVKLLNATFERCLLYESSKNKLFRLCTLLLGFTSNQWLKKLQDMIMLGAEIDQLDPDMFVTEDNKSAVPQTLILDSSKIPVFFSSNLANRCLEIMNCKTALAEFGSEAVNLEVHQLKLPFQWVYDSDSLAEFDRKVDEYQESVDEFLKVYHKVIKRTRSFQNDTLHSSNNSSLPSSTSLFHVDLKILDSDSLDRSFFSDEFSHTCQLVLEDGLDSGSLNIQLPLSLSPYIWISNPLRIQWQLANSLVMRMFRDGAEQLLDHACILRQIHLLGSGYLVSLLEDFLYGRGDSQETSTLDLNSSASQWPPSLSSVHWYLSSCIDKVVETLPQVVGTDFINFAARIFSEVDPYKDEACHSESLRATDVLRLVYMVPDPISLIFTGDTLIVYDWIFRKQLQVLRVQNAYKRLYRQYQRDKKIIASIGHFISCFSFYVTCCIDHFWKLWIADVENYFNSKVQSSLHRLICRHRQTVNSIAKALFLDTNTGLTQGPGIVSDELFQRIINLLHAPENHTGYREIGVLIKRFISLCSHNVTNGSLDNIVSILILQLNYNNFYDVSEDAKEGT